MNFSKLLFISVCCLATLGCRGRWHDLGLEREGHYEQKLDASKPLKLDLGVGGYKIEPGSSDKIVVTYWSRGNPRNVHIRLDAESGRNLLKIEAPHSNFRATIEIPPQSDLSTQLGVGNLDIKGITGNKDVSVGTGNLNLDVISADQYGKVDASTGIGNIIANPFGSTGHGIGSSLEKEGQGKYRLHAHVGVGNLKLYAENTM